MFKAFIQIHRLTTWVIIIGLSSFDTRMNTAIFQEVFGRID